LPGEPNEHPFPQAHHNVKEDPLRVDLQNIILLIGDFKTVLESVQANRYFVGLVVTVCAELGYPLEVVALID
jgi:hypothetical protein